MFIDHGPQTIPSIEPEKCVYTKKQGKLKIKSVVFGPITNLFFILESRFPSKNGSTPKGTNQTIGG